MSGACVFGEACLLIDDVVDAAPVGLHIAGGAPQISAERWCPLPRRVPAILAELVNDWAAESF